jgi:anti-sigma28 factor (negative regulator of flagellin synthesis)
MEIKRPDIVNLINKVYRQERVRGKGTHGGTENAPPAGDRVEISSASEVLKKELARLEKADAARNEKIADLSRRIESGEHKVESRELADLILKAIKEEHSHGSHD